MLSNERIKLRKMTLEDTEIYHKWRNDYDVMSYTDPSFDTRTYEETETFVKQVTQANDSKSYIIEYRENEKAIGITSLIHIDTKNRNAECIIDIGEKDYWGQGIGKEALTMLLDYAFLELNLHKVSLRVFSFNDRAITLYEKLGFEKEGELKEQLYRNGGWQHIIMMGLLKRNFQR